MRDFYDSVTKIWAVDTNLEQEEMHETHNPFTEQQLAHFCQETGFRINRMMSLTSIDGYLDYYKILVETKSGLLERHFIIYSRR
jgi:hypothetical protein